VGKKLTKLTELMYIYLIDARTGLDIVNENNDELKSAVILNNDELKSAVILISSFKFKK